MASQAYRDWLAAGSPYVRARPTLELKVLLQGYGYTVYDYPNIPHLEAEPPEDHTPFSATGYPITSKRWVGHADDVMPPDAAARAKGAIPLPALARQIIADTDRRAPGTLWIKYMNWTDEAGVCRQENWANPTRTRFTKSSTDKGHIHISGRSDTDDSDQVSRSGWNPVEGEMADSLIAYNTGWLTQLGTIGLKDPVVIPKDASVPGSGSTVVNELARQLKRINDSAAAAVSALLVTNSRLTSIETRLAAIENAPPGSGLTVEQTVDAVKQALREGAA